MITVLLAGEFCKEKSQKSGNCSIPCNDFRIESLGLTANRMSRMIKQFSNFVLNNVFSILFDRKASSWANKLKVRRRPMAVVFKMVVLQA